MVELLVGLLLSNLVIILVLQGYLLLQRVILQIEERFALAEKADIVAWYLRQDIKFSGYRGVSSCDPNLVAINQARILSSLTGQAQVLITKKVFPGCAVKDLPIKIANKIANQEIQANTQLLVIKDIPGNIYALAQPVTDLCAVIKLVTATDLLDGSLLAIANARNIERFVVTKVIANKYLFRDLLTNKNNCFQYAYDLTAKIIALQWAGYYLGKSSVTTQGYTLYRDNIVANAESIIDGVEDFAVQLIYVDQAKTIILGVKVELLLKGKQKIFSKQNFFWHGHHYNVNDGYLHVPISFTIARYNVCK